MISDDVQQSGSNSWFIAQYSSNQRVKLDAYDDKSNPTPRITPLSPGDAGFPVNPMTNKRITNTPKWSWHNRIFSKLANTELISLIPKDVKDCLQMM